jgi:hypothetical protein
MIIWKENHDLLEGKGRSSGRKRKIIWKEKHYHLEGKA